MLTDKKISVVAGCYNESENIGPLYRRLVKALSEITSHFEIIFADNASTDNSEAVLRKLAGEDPRVKVLFFSRNFGSSQSGLTAGTELATGDAIVWIDGDQQDPPELIREFVKKWLEGYHIVYGVRNTRKGGGLLKRAAYKFFYRILRRFAYIDIPVDAGDFGLIDRRIADILRNMPERDRYLRGLRAWVGFRSVGIPYVRDVRHGGVSSETWLKNIYWARKAIFSFSYKPLEWVLFFSFSVVALSFVLIVWIIAAYFLLGTTPKGLTTVIILILFLGGIQLLSIAVIGEYVGRIFEEVKGRPTYVIREILNG